MLHDSFETLTRRTYLRLQSNVQIAPLVKRIFHETYGVEDDELYHNDELRDKIRGAVKTLRLAYQNSTCVTNYDTEEIRKAYMIAYYPYFIEPAHYVMKILFEKSGLDWDEQGIQLEFLACGPCPELYGVLLAINDKWSNSGYFKDVDVRTYDAEREWLKYQRITRHLCVDTFGAYSIRDWQFRGNFFIGKSKSFDETVCHFYAESFGGETVWAISDEDPESPFSPVKVFFIQNYLSHMPDTSEVVDNFLKWFSELVVRSHGDFFVFIDLNYNSTATVFRKLSNEDFLRVNGLEKMAAHIPDFGNPLEIHHSDTTPAIGEKIFTGEYGLVKRFLTKFYFVVLKKFSGVI